MKSYILLSTGHVVEHEEDQFQENMDPDDEKKVLSLDVYDGKIYPFGDNISNTIEFSEMVVSFKDIVACWK